MIPSLNGLAALVPGQPDVAAAIDGLRPLAALIQDGWLTGASKKYDALPESTKQELTKAVQRLITASDELTPWDTSNVEWAKRLAITVQQMEVTLRLGPLSPSLTRDQALAANTLWILDRLPPDERATYWAHNAHVQKAPIKRAPVGNGRFLGSRTLLRQALERRYYAIGTAYGGPSMDDRTPAAAGSLDQALEQAVDRSFLLRLRTRPTEVAEWLNLDRPIRFQTGYLTATVGEAFDTVIYMNRVGRAIRAAE